MQKVFSFLIFLSLGGLVPSMGLASEAQPTAHNATELEFSQVEAEEAQIKAEELKQVSLARWGVGAGQYSGIASIGQNRFAVVSDKEPADGFFVFRIEQDGQTGEITDVSLEGFYGNQSPEVDANGISIRDCEGIAFCPTRESLFISGEGDQEILEYTLLGQPTGRKLNVPSIFASDKISPNSGFEALTYDSLRHRFWVTTESTLPADGTAASSLHPGVANILRLQSFGDDLQPLSQYAYRMDTGKADNFGGIYTFGVPAIEVLPDGRLLVLEREIDISKNYLNSTCRCKLFCVNPAEGYQIDSSCDLTALDPNKFLVKHLLADFSTRLTAVKYNFANFEGMCLGRPLDDGRLSLLLISDSQGGYKKGPVHLKDYVKVILLELD